MSDWNPILYMKFEDERMLAARDLLARVPLASADLVYDLGCGPGNSAELLLATLPGRARSSASTPPTRCSPMRACARRSARFVKQDIADWAPTDRPDLIFANAALHFLPDHDRLFPRLCRYLAPGGAFAAQMPNDRARILACADAHGRGRRAVVVPPRADRQDPAADRRLSRTITTGCGRSRRGSTSG